MNHTKAQIVEAFRQLLEEKPFRKITVKNIVDRCGINRNTFYYHYQDIPSLLEQTLKEKIDVLIGEHCHLGVPEDCISVTVQYFTQNKNAILHIYRSLPREVFLKYLDPLLLYLVNEYMENISADLPLDDPDKSLLIRYYKCTLVGLFLDWMDADMGYDLHHDARRICELQANAWAQVHATAPPPV